MKYRSIRLLAANICAASLGLAAVSAQPYYAPGYVSYPANDIGFYFNADVGPDFMQDFHSSRFGFPATFSTRPGVRFGAEPGFNFIATPQLTLGAEFETGIAYNYLHNINQTTTGASMRGDYYQVPILANLVLRINTGTFVQPYLGIGGGGDFSEAHVRWPGFGGFERTSDEIDPAAAGIAGVRFHLSPFMSVGVEYKYLAAIPSEGSYVATHAVMASFTARF